MAAPGNINEFLDLVRKSSVLDEKRLEAYVHKLRSSPGTPSEPAKLAGLMVRDGLLTQFQAEQIMQGKWRRFTIGKYKVLEKVGSGGMGSVYLCEHQLMRRRVAVKVLPAAKAADPSALERFYREARAVAALDHANIVHAYDIDQDETLHFLVMEYVDGTSLQDIVKKTGPMSPLRAAHYIRQAAFGLEHAHRAGLVHRDIKPGNLLVDRNGLVKILDMGLARFFNDEEDVLTKKYDENVLGTADYLAPEQALDSHSVDIRADIYSLGATFYYLLTGRTPFGEGTVAQKLIWHQTRQPKSITTHRQDVPPGLTAILEKMMAKDPDQRFLVPEALAKALEPWTQETIDPPSETEMPHLSPAAMAATGASGEMTPPVLTNIVTSPPGPPAPAKAWTVTTTPRPATHPEGPAPAAPMAPPPQPAPAAAKLSGSRERPPAAPLRGTSHPELLPPAKTSPSVELVPKAPSAKPSSAPPAPVAVQELTSPPASPQQADQEEDAAWEELALATKDSITKANTPSQRSRSGSGRRTGRPAPPVVEDRRTWYLVGGVAGVCLLLLVLAWLFLFHQADVLPPSGAKPLVVTKDPNRAGAYKSVFLALLSSREGDVIELWDDRHEENLRWEPLDHYKVKHVTIQPAPGKTVTWGPVPGKDEKANLLYLLNAHGFRIKGPNLTFDGTIDAKKNSFVQDLVFLYSFNKGLVLEDLALQNFKNTGVFFLNCGGASGQPVRLQNLEITAAKNVKARSAIFFEARPNHFPLVNEFIEITDCRFFGVNPKGAITVNGDKSLGFGVTLPKTGVDILKTDPPKAKTDPPKAKTEPPKAELPKAKTETPKAEPQKAKTETPKAEPQKAKNEPSKK